MYSSVSVIIPTYNRPQTLKLVFEALKNQTYQNFNVIVVYKPEIDETELVIEEYKDCMMIHKVKQHDGYFLDALNLGLKKADGEIIAFLDDDSVPKTDWLYELVKTYYQFDDVGGVSGYSFTVTLSKDGKFKKIPEVYTKTLLPWSFPIKGMGDWIIFYGKDGQHHFHRDFNKTTLSKNIVPGMLFMGCNMSVRKEAVSNIKFDKDLVLGFGNEQIISYQIFKKGYKIYFNPKVSTNHIIQEQSLGRFYTSSKRAALRDAEYVLSFFILKYKLQDEQVSITAFSIRLIELIFSRIINIRKYRKNFIYKIYGLIFGVVIGLSFVVSKSVNGKFSIRNSLITLF